VIENQLDVVHVPFVHHNTIGRGNRTLVDGPAVRWVDDTMFYVYVRNRVDDGTPPLKPRDASLQSGSTRLAFIFPNLWQNFISEKVRIVAAFVPVYQEHTILYLHFFQKFLRVPVLRTLVNTVAMSFNLYVAHQDRVIVETHQPQPTALRMPEQLIRGDHPVIEYRRRRQQLLEEQSGQVLQEPVAYLSGDGARATPER
jgi:phenylpropionate dioxygenase-like ring-hydroxylating dioxygenase large terminal subunit